MTDKFIFRFVAAVSVFVFVVVLVLNRRIIPAPSVAPSFTHYLPKLNALLNGTCSLLLLTSLYFIKQKKITVHKRLNILTFCLSSLFLPLTQSSSIGSFAAKDGLDPNQNARQSKNYYKSPMPA